MSSYANVGDVFDDTQYYNFGTISDPSGLYTVARQLLRWLAEATTSHVYLMICGALRTPTLWNGIKVCQDRGLGFDARFQ